MSEECECACCQVTRYLEAGRACGIEEADAFAMLMVAYNNVYGDPGELPELKHTPMRIVH